MSISIGELGLELGSLAASSVVPPGFVNGDLFDGGTAASSNADIANGLTAASRPTDIADGGTAV